MEQDFILQAIGSGFKALQINVTGRGNIVSLFIKGANDSVEKPDGILK